MNTRQRVLARVILAGRIREQPAPDRTDGAVRLVIRVHEVTVDEVSSIHRTAQAPVQVPLSEYRAVEPDPLYLGAAEHLQHLNAHHPEAIGLLTRLCDREIMIGVTRVLPIALDRYGIVLRVERSRGDRDVRLPFSRRIGTGAEAATEMRLLLARAARRRPCGGARR